MEPITPWTADRPVRSPFARPYGLSGRIAGRVMLWTERAGKRHLLDLLDVRPGERVLEVGYGPGALVRALTGTRAERICGVDPSPEMRRQAVKRNRASVGAGRVDLRQGTAGDTGFRDAAFDCVVSVNNVALWPDLEAGMRELHRVAGDGGRVLVSWHGGTAPSLIGRGLVLPEDVLRRIGAAMRDRFTSVERCELSEFTVFAARK
ncbi:class I SAM-dependent methyltransferase [Nocardiopsis suaedae]|uniref:Methyltransferase domain-containing protein n=1 Tax=Nocardiopsis suaedae TaxID=3018444 RepID=A0ABT4TPH4_9ACTN|nr:methyltransferase domain-containing protein [Nocardiopsis suaedae]MDA2806536.1 methyltransferase domain-containing protein [Nocardiopsis suaedae]